jgi:hypothetical protein
MIGKDELRVGTTVPGPGDYDITSWRHLACSRKRPAPPVPASLPGFHTLKEADKAIVRAWLDGDMVTATAHKRKADLAAAEDAASAGLSTPKRPKKAASDATPPATKPALPSLSSSLSTEVEKRDAAAAVFNRLTIPALKSCLRANDQLLGGTKPELVDRCVDRKLYGSIPRCPQCGLGKLKVSYRQAFGHRGEGRFTCPGGYDDDAYQPCHYRAERVDRLPWKVTDDEASAPLSPKHTGGKATAMRTGTTPSSSGGGASHDASSLQQQQQQQPVPEVRMPGEDE